MHMECKLKILSSGKNHKIVTCSCCGRVSMHYQDLLVEFEQEAFLRWANWVLEVDYMKLVRKPEGDSSFVSLRTCHPRIQFIFDKEGFSELQQIFSEVLLLLGVFEYSRVN